MFNGKKKALTFSYDDGVTQDRRLIDIFNRYNLKATFNINSGLLGTSGALIRNGLTISHVKPRECEIKEIYKGHEVAVHTLTHPTLTTVEDDKIIRQVNDDAAKLAELTGYEIAGMAYPGGGVNYDSRVSAVIKENTSMKYARTTVCTGNFELQSNLLEFRPTVYHLNWGEMFALAERFIKLEPDEPKLFYIWGHSYEFDFENTWGRMEEFCKMIANRDDIFYGTNKEVLL